MTIQACQSQKNVPLCAEAVSQCGQITLEKVNRNSFLMIISRLHHNWKTRQQLTALSELQRKDVGLSKEDIRMEVNKPIWTLR